MKARPGAVYNFKKGYTRFMQRSVCLVLLLLGTLACSRQESAQSRARIARSPAPEQPAPEPRSEAFDERREERARLVDRIAERGVKSEQVLAAMRKVPRHAFVPSAWSENAYEDRPLPIGHGQTISQPMVVAAMTEAVAPKRADKCLEIGTGSGYQAAVLAELCARVYSIEYLAPLAAEAERALRGAGYGPDRVALRTGDGYVGWPEAAPFEAIVVTAAPEKVPQPLLDQLAIGGRLVIPVGPQSEGQDLLLYTRLKPGPDPSSFEKKSLMAVRFVPFLGDGEKRSN
jgi:protein-L-isoaspartate(D-aspartate) O-methyltransferase